MHGIETLKKINDRKVVNVVQNPDKPVAAQVIADAIVEIAKAMKTLNDSRLKRRAIVTLLHDATTVSRTDIGDVLNGLEQLEKEWLK
jgi:hypothetical protein